MATRQTPVRWGYGIALCTRCHISSRAWRGARPTQTRRHRCRAHHGETRRVHDLYLHLDCPRHWVTYILAPLDKEKEGRGQRYDRRVF